MRGGRIFLSYRRDDTSGHAGRLFDRLNAAFPERVFMDVSRIEIGSDFVEAIETAVASCQVVIALMGKNWLTAADAGGRRRLDNSKDFVRIELATALRRRILIIPALVGDAVMPNEEDLPDDLKPLARRQALEFSGQAFDHDIDRLIAKLEEALGEKRADRMTGRAAFSHATVAAPPKKSRPWRWFFAGTGVALIGVVYIVMVAIENMERVAQDLYGGASIGASPAAGAASPAASPVEQPARPQSAGFRPVGNWDVQIHDVLNSRMQLNLLSNNTFHAVQQAGYSSLVATGTWTYSPQRKFLLLAGMVGGVSPFAMSITFSREDGDAFHGFDQTGIQYVFNRE